MQVIVENLNGSVIPACFKPGSSLRNMDSGSRRTGMTCFFRSVFTKLSGIFFTGYVFFVAITTKRRGQGRFETLILKGFLVGTALALPSIAKSLSQGFA